VQLEELQQQWNRLDQKVERALSLETELVRRVIVQPARTRVQRQAFWPAIDIALCVGGILLIALFDRNHRHDWRAMAPAGVATLSLIALFATSVRQLQLVAEIDWTRPVAEIQRALERLRLAKIRQFKWVILLAPLVGFCGLVVALQWLITWASAGQHGMFDKFEHRWIVANYVFGVLFIPLGYTIARMLAARCGHHRWWQSVLDDISGKSLKSAAADIDRWARLQRDEA
jgi:hypothetical protein